MFRRRTLQLVALTWIDECSKEFTLYGLYREPQLQGEEAVEPRICRTLDEVVRLAETEGCKVDGPAVQLVDVARVLAEKRLLRKRWLGRA